MGSHAFQNASPLNAPLLCQVTLFKMAAFECTSISHFPRNEVEAQ
jgi:hypothetical protein